MNFLTLYRRAQEVAAPCQVDLALNELGVRVRVSHERDGTRCSTRQMWTLLELEQNQAQSGVIICDAIANMRDVILRAAGAP